MDFVENLQNQVSEAKTSIDLKIKYLKAELDRLRGSYFKELDEQEKEILK